MERNGCRWILFCPYGMGMPGLKGYPPRAFKGNDLIAVYQMIGNASA